MYRDDVCAVCGESLPPDHLYCRAHAAEVDDIVRRIGELLPRVTADLSTLATDLSHIADETWDFLAEDEPDDPVWPPVPEVRLRTDADEVDVDVDTEPGMVRARITASLSDLLSAVADALRRADLDRFSEACAAAEDVGGTH